jgi:NAD(P)-dependent dehydrogenase (short-subunit alcohol dehydrogenase family)
MGILPKSTPLSGRAALVTGGTAGIGLATAAALAAAGARVFVTGRRQHALDDAVRTIGHDATGIRADISDPSDLDKVFAEIGQSADLIDILHANAGVGSFAALADVTAESFDTAFGISVRGTVFTLQKAVPLLADGASVIIAGSIVARGAAGLSIYAATKAALHSLARSWAIELAARHIRVNTIVPGSTETPGLVELCRRPGECGGGPGADGRSSAPGKGPHTVRDRRCSGFFRIRRQSDGHRVRDRRRWGSDRSLIRTRAEPGLGSQGPGVPRDDIGWRESPLPVAADCAVKVRHLQDGVCSNDLDGQSEAVQVVSASQSGISSTPSHVRCLCSPLRPVQPCAALMDAALRQ